MKMSFYATCTPSAALLGSYSHTQLVITHTHKYIHIQESQIYLVLAQEPVVFWRVLRRKLGSSAGGDSLRFLVDFLKPAVGGGRQRGEKEDDTSGGLREATSYRCSRCFVFYGGKFGTFGKGPCVIWI